jgi:hypothetical protein
MRYQHLKAAKDLKAAKAGTMSQKQKKRSKAQKFRNTRGEAARIDLFLYRMNRIREYRPWTAEERLLVHNAVSRHKHLMTVLNEMTPPRPRRSRAKQQASQARGNPRTAGSVMTIRNR